MFDKKRNYLLFVAIKKITADRAKSHSEHLRNNIGNYTEYEEKFKNETLLNCGIIGGNFKVMQEFIEKLAMIHQQYNFDNKTAYEGKDFPNEGDPRSVGIGVFSICVNKYRVP